MTKFLLLFVIFLKIAYGANSQTTKNDTICLPIAQAQTVLIDAKQKKVLEAENTLLHTDISVLNSIIREKDMRIAGKDSIITEYKAKDTLNRTVVLSFQDELKLVRGERELDKQQIATLEKSLKRQKTATKLTALGGLLLAVGVAFLFHHN